MGKLLSLIARNFPGGPYARLQRAMRDPAASQTQILKRLLKTASQTEFGKRHNFAGLLRETDVVKAYQRTVPLAADADVRADLNRMLHREPDILWPGVCRYGAVSGGTTTQGKLFPIMDETLYELRQASLCVPLSFLAERGSAHFLRGKILTLGGTVQSNTEYGGLLTGELSGVLSHHVMHARSKPPKWMAVPPIDPALSWNEKLDFVARQTIQRDVRMMVCLPGWGIQLFRKLLELAQQQPGKKPSTIGEIWPNLQLLVSAGSPLSPCRDTLLELIGLPQMQLRESYGATQGYIAAQTSGADEALQVLIGGSIFFEFVPWEQFGTNTAERFSLAEVQTDTLYVPYLTTCNGLWSFCLEDIVRFSSVRPHKLLVAGRTAEFLSPMGEYIIREQVQASLDAACRETDAVVEEYHMAPAPADQGHGMKHQLLVEFDRTALDTEKFAAAFDAALQEANPRYKTRRQNAGFESVEVVALPRGTFLRWLEASRREVHSQSKIPRLRETRVVADALLSLGGIPG